MGDALFGLIEAGGTKFIAGLAGGHDDVRAVERFATTTPEETIGAVIAWLRQQAAAGGGLRAIGIASFGPLELDRAASNWGRMLRTPKPGWSDADIVGPFAAGFGVPVAIDTDVNGAALAESLWGAAQDVRSSVYITVGTGIGGGAVVDGATLRGLGHPEMGHMSIRRHAEDLGFRGVCPFHDDCLEGVASGPSVTARWGATLSELPCDHPGRAIIAYYIAQCCTTLRAVLSPGKILLGGGVMDTPGLLDLVRDEVDALGADYFPARAADLVAAPTLAPHSGLLGALALAQTAP